MSRNKYKQLYEFNCNPVVNSAYCLLCDYEFELRVGDIMQSILCPQCGQYVKVWSWHIPASFLSSEIGCQKMKSLAERAQNSIRQLKKNAPAPN